MINNQKNPPGVRQSQQIIVAILAQKLAQHIARQFVAICVPYEGGCEYP